MRDMQKEVSVSSDEKVSRAQWFYDVPELAAIPTGKGSLGFLKRMAFEDLENRGLSTEGARAVLSLDVIVPTEKEREDTSAGPRPREARPREAQAVVKMPAGALASRHWNIPMRGAREELIYFLERAGEVPDCYEVEICITARLPPGRKEEP